LNLALKPVTHLTLKPPLGPEFYDFPMDWGVFLSVFLGSGIVGALVGSWVSLRVSERQILIENVTKERTKWRHKIRDITLKIQAGGESNDPKEKKTLPVKTLPVLSAEIALWLNPNDAEDEKIMSCIHKLIDNPGDKERLCRDLTLRVAHLLKYH